MVKKAANTGHALERLIASSDMGKSEWARKLNISQPHLSNIASGRRNMPNHIAERTVQSEDDAEYILDTMHAFSDGYTSPILRGSSIEHHRLALAHSWKGRVREVLDSLEADYLSKTPEAITASEREEVKQLIDNLLEARILDDNLLARLQIDYGISIKHRIKQMTPRWKAKGWLQ